jgi:monooxygenase
MENLAASRHDTPVPLNPTAETTEFDVLIVGAGLSGIDAAYHLQDKCPNKTVAILEGRSVLGGTWDLFRYPGVRSDSDMHTLGYRFRPWREAKAIADGPSILRYLRETAEEYGIDRKIRFEHRAVRASWSSADARWTVEAIRPDGQVVKLTGNFLYMCSGYYEYEAGYMPGWPGMERFTGRVVHPQKWPEDLDYSGKRVVVIGSGATAVTLVPAMTDKAAHVTMLQRSPTYIVTRPSEDVIANWLHRRLPSWVAHGLARWKNIFLQMYFYNAARRKPDEAKKTILKFAQKELGPDYDVAKHFNPSYNPWDQRLCLVPDGDLFAAIRAGKASVVTDEIETFTEHGIRLRSGEELDADIVVTATGLKMRLMGGMQVVVDGKTVDFSKTMTYKGMMSNDVPNMALALGYTNASWTLKCDLTSEYVCRLLNFMEERGYVYCAPRKPDSAIAEEPALSFTSGYVQRALASLPKQGSKKPWRLNQNYALDLLALRFGELDDGTMQFVRPRRRQKVS